MPAEDRIHPQVRNALVNDGWTILAAPFTIEYEGVRVFADICAEHLDEEGDTRRIIVVEIKSFVGPSPVHELELALGQYQVYLSYLEVIAPHFRLYLAVSEDTYETFFLRAAIELILRRHRVALIVVDTEKEVIVQWIEPPNIVA